MPCAKPRALPFFIRNNLWKSATSFVPTGANFSFVPTGANFSFVPPGANLDSDVYRRFIKKECPAPINKSHFSKRNLRKLYGEFGAQSGLNAGIAWPTREELQEVIEHDKMFHPSLREMLDKIAAADQEKMRERLEYEAEVDKNVAKLETYMVEYYAKIEKKKRAVFESKQRDQQRLEEIRELLGYDVDPKDPKFLEALEMIKREEKKAKKQKKQQESYEKMLAKLASVEASSKKAALEDQGKSEKTTEGTEDDKPEVCDSKNPPK